MTPRLLLTSLVAGAALTAAAALPDSIHYELQVQQNITHGTVAPFWLTANRNGLGSAEPQAGYLRAAAWRDMTWTAHWGWSAGADLAGAWNYPSAFTVRQLYASVRYRAFELTAGAKLADPTYSDAELGSGDLLYSGNALPIPQLRLSMPRWLEVPGTRGLFGVKAYIAYGMFTDGNWQKKFAAPGSLYDSNVLYHAKGLKVHIGRTHGTVCFEGGLDMAAQFGGKSMRRVADGDDVVVVNMPNRLKDFWDILFPRSGDSSTPLGEQLNINGNHVGEWSARFSVRPGGGWLVQPYYLHYFDDHSMMFFDYQWKDCLAGIKVGLPANRWVSEAVYEYVATRDQSGPVYWDKTDRIPEQVSGRDNYYNHYIYTGWNHWGQGIGNPLVISPIFNADHKLLFECNRIEAHHIGLKGQPSNTVSWRLLADYTRGWGTYDRPYESIRRATNLLLEVTVSPAKIPGWSFTAGGAATFGNLLGRSQGLQLTITKSGIL